MDLDLDLLVRYAEGASFCGVGSPASWGERGVAASWCMERHAGEGVGCGAVEGC